VDVFLDRWRNRWQPLPNLASPEAAFGRKARKLIYNAAQTGCKTETLAKTEGVVYVSARFRLRIGAGLGFMGGTASDEVLGLDIDHRCVAVAKTRFSNRTYLQGAGAGFVNPSFSRSPGPVGEIFIVSAGKSKRKSSFAASRAD
jgi:hypothetical protein